MKQNVLDTILKFAKSSPKLFHNPASSARFFDRRYEEALKEHGHKIFDLSWQYQQHCEGIEYKGNRLKDLGPQYHEIFNSQLTLFSQNGATLGNQVMSQCLSKKNVLIQCNSHISVYTGLLLAGANIHIVAPKYNSEYDFFYPVTVEDVSKALAKNPEIEAIYLTSPSFEGLTSDYQAIREAFPDHIFFVDEAHGTHYYFDQKNFPRPALLCGADMTSNSAYKAIGSLSATAFINVGRFSKIEKEVVRDSYFLFHTSSLNFLMVVDAESSVHAMATRGEELLGRARDLAQGLKSRLERVEGIQVFEWKEQSHLADKTKLVVKVQGMDGQSLSETMEKDFNMYFDKHTNEALLLTFNPLMLDSEIEEAYQAFKSVAQRARNQPSKPADADEKRGWVMGNWQELLTNRHFKVDLRDVQASKKLMVPLEQCKGRVSADLYYTCPPGFPLLIQGEVIQDTHLEFLRGKEETLKVLA